MLERWDRQEDALTEEHKGDDGDEEVSAAQEAEEMQEAVTGKGTGNAVDGMLRRSKRRRGV